MTLLPRLLKQASAGHALAFKKQGGHCTYCPREHCQMMLYTCTCGLFERGCDLCYQPHLREARK